MANAVTTTRKGNARARMDQVLKRVATRVEKGLIAAANVLLDESLKLVPRDTTALAGSAVITQSGEGLSTVVYAGYGLKKAIGRVIRGPGETNYAHPGRDREGREVFRVPSNYAWVQHFNRRGRPPFHHVTGQADFLGEPSRTKIPQMRAAFNQALRVEAT